MSLEVERRSRDRFTASADLHPLREGGTLNYLWWTFDRLDFLRPLLRPGV